MAGSKSPPANRPRAALWLQPKPGSQLHNVLRQTIAGLAPIFEDAPVFDPHVTITTGIIVNNQPEIDLVLDSAIAAAKSVSQLVVRLGKVTYGNKYFRKVVFEVQPTAELVSLASIAKEEFVLYPQIKHNLSKSDGFKSKGDQAINEEALSQAAKEAVSWVQNEFQPHLSLVYSDLYPVTEATKHTVHQRLQDIFGSHYETKGLGWSSGQLSLVLCDGPVESWKVLGTRFV